MEIDGELGVLKPSQVRVWKLHQAVSRLLEYPFLSSRNPSVILGHFTFLWCIDRKLLCIPHACYQFVNKGFKTPKRLLDSVLRELRWARDTIFLVRANCALSFLIQ